MTLPAPGSLIGWAIFYGDKLNLTAMVWARDCDRAHAMQRAVDLHGVLCDLIVGPEVVDSRPGVL